MDLQKDMQAAVPPENEMQQVNDAQSYYQQIYQKAGLPVIKETQEKKAEYFKLLRFPSLLYAIVYTICMYRNNSGITMSVWIAATVIYAVYVMRGLDSVDADGECIGKFRLKRGSNVYITIMALLGIATFLTGNGYVIFMNYIGFFIILIAFLLHNFYDDSKWDFGKSVLEIIAAVGGALECMFTPFMDGNAFLKGHKTQKNTTMRYIAIGVVCAVPALLILGRFLVSADAVFEVLVEEMLSSPRISGKKFGIFVMLVFGFFSSYCGMRFLAKRSRDIQISEHKKYEPIIAITFTSLIASMYVVFCLIQIMYLFAGNMQLPEGMSYAQYARTGFFQLLFVCFVNFCLVVLIKKYFTKSRALDVALLVLCLCTFVMIASSTWRMLMYIDAYQLTFLRVFVLTALAALTLLMAGAVAAILRPAFALFRYCIIVVSIIYLLFAFAHVDYIIASYNLSQAGMRAENTDWWYLSTLSTDAAPAVAAYVEKNEMDEEALKQVEEDVQQEEYRYAAEPDNIAWYAIYLFHIKEDAADINIRNFNMSRYLARKYLINKL